MFGSVVLDVGIGLVLVYLIFSLFCSAIQEWVARLLALRATALRQGVNELLASGKEDGLAAVFHAHPLIEALKPQRVPVIRRMLGHEHACYPSYMSAQTFALAVMDLTMTITAPPGGAPRQATLATTIKGSPTPVPAVIQKLVQDVEGDAAVVRHRLETWFDDSMERISGWYKRRTQVILFIVGAIIAAAFDVDTIAITKRLAAEPALRAALVAQAQRVTKDTTLAGVQQGVATQIDGMEGAGLLIGWPKGCAPLASGPSSCGLSWLTVLGILITTIALSFGAPFWFDALNNIANLRQTGTPPTQAKSNAN